MNDPIAIEDVRRLDVRPGDALVIRLGREPDRDAAQRLQDRLVEAFGDGIRILIVGPGDDVSVLRPVPEVTPTPEVHVQVEGAVRSERDLAKELAELVRLAPRGKA